MQDNTYPGEIQRNLPPKPGEQLLISHIEQMLNTTNMITEKVGLYFMLAYLIAIVLWLYEGDIRTETFRN